MIHIKYIVTNIYIFSQRRRRKRNHENTTSIEDLRFNIPINDTSLINVIRQERPILRFTSTPEPRPLTVTFNITDFLTHAAVLYAVKDRFRYINPTKVVGLQCVSRDVLLGSRGLGNRWLITVDNKEGVSDLLRRGLVIHKKSILLRKYDDVISDEHKTYKKTKTMAEGLSRKSLAERLLFLGRNLNIK